MLEYGHKSFINALLKLLGKEFNNQISNLLIVLWANQLTVRIFTGFSSYYIKYKNKSTFFIHIKIFDWQKLINNIYMWITML